MRVCLARSTPDGEFTVELDDEIEEFNPLRTSDLCRQARELFRLALADQAHADAEHEKPAES